MKKKGNKLALAKETLRSLEISVMGDVVGASKEALCPLSIETCWHCPPPPPTET